MLPEVAALGKRRVRASGQWCKSIWTKIAKMLIFEAETRMKRIADWLEKISAGSILIGLYQNNLWAIAIGLGALAGSIYMTRRLP